MMQHWIAQEHSLEIASMPFYWRLSYESISHPLISARMPVHLRVNSEFDYLELEMHEEEQANLELAYRQNENIGFINPTSGQIHTYGASVNNFLLSVARATQPKKIYEIGCGAGFSIMFMGEHGWKVTGIDPSDYSYQWSKQIGFELINDFFSDQTLKEEADLIFCNDVFEHIKDVTEFSRNVWKALRFGGTFCFATTNSTESILLGDISMLEHQHVNMFTERSIHLILHSAGFSNIKVEKGSYGNTFQVTAQKARTSKIDSISDVSCKGFFERASNQIQRFERIYEQVQGKCQFYVPLRCIPYLATVGDFGNHNVYDSNLQWRGKYIDGYSRPILSKQDINSNKESPFFIGSMTFFDAIKNDLIKRGVRTEHIYGINSPAPIN